MVNIMKLSICFLTILIATTISIDRVGIRKDVKSLSDAEKQEILYALHQMKLSPSRYNSSLTAYDYFPSVHAQSMRIVKSHRTWAFLPWHRAFLFFFEKELNYYMNRTDSNQFKLPYWNPTSVESTEKTLLDCSFLGGNGDETSDPPYLVSDECALGGTAQFPVRDGFGILTLDPYNDPINTTFNYPSLARWIFKGSIDPNLGIKCGQEREDKSVWDSLYKINVYDVEPYNNSFNIWNVSHCSRSFRAQLEGCNPYNYTFGCRRTHSILHRIIGGHQMAIPWSPNDPLFFMLHGWIDLMWAKWQDIHGINNFPVSVVDEALFYNNDFNQSDIAAKGVLDVRDLFYEYDLQQEEDDKWYEEYMQILIVIGGIVLVLVIVCCVCWRCKKSKKNKSELYKQIDENKKTYGTNQNEMEPV